MKKYYSISPIFNPNGIGSGFFSNYRICLEKLIHHHENGGVGKPYINWANTPFVDGFNPIFVNGETTGEFMTMDDTINPFDLWFEQEIPYKLDVPIEDIIISEIGRPSGVGKWIYHNDHYFNNPTELKRQQTIDRLYIKPKQYIIDKVDKIFEEEFKGQVVLAVMARGSEYNKWHGDIYGISTIDKYIEEIGKVLSGNPDITKLLIVSDETEYVDKINKAFPESYFVPNIFRRTDETLEYINEIPYWMNISEKRENHCALLGEEVVIQTKLLAKCDYLFGRHCGILAGAVLWNENIKKVFII